MIKTVHVKTRHDQGVKLDFDGNFIFDRYTVRMSKLRREEYNFYIVCEWLNSGFWRIKYLVNF